MLYCKWLKSTIKGQNKFQGISIEQSSSKVTDLKFWFQVLELSVYIKYAHAI